MSRWIDTHFDRMALTLLVWLCGLPLVVLTVAPLFGLTMAAVAALVLFLVALAVCWSICSWKNERR
jgi:hypothetical protein